MLNDLVLHGIVGGKSKDKIPPPPISNFQAKADDKKVLLSWVNPIDTDFVGVRILRKTEGYPSSPTDGVLVYSGGGTTYEDTGLTNDVTYYYRAFSFDWDKNFNDDISQQVSATPTESKIYGVEIDENNSNPETAVVYTDDAVGFTPARGNNGNFDWGSWEDIIKNEFKIRPCVLKNLGGGNAEVNYYLDYDDYTKKADGSAAVLDGTNGDVMVEFGVPLYWKFTRVDNKLKIQLSAKPFERAVKYAFEIEDGYNQMPIYPLFLTQIIYLLMFKHLDSQTALGRGYVDGNTDFLNTGTSNNRPFMFGETTGKQQMKFLGIEDYWGNRRWWIDGCFYDNNRNMLIGKGNFNDKGNGYTNYGQATPSDGGGYIDKIQGQNETGFIPASMSGSVTTFYCDNGNVYAGRLPSFGGHQSNGDYAGAFSLSSSTAATSIATVGGRLFYSKDSKIYIGAYLGVNQGGKLRSISGYESHNNATIGEFRTLARANNN